MQVFEYNLELDELYAQHRDQWNTYLEELGDYFGFIFPDVASNPGI